MGHRKQKGQGNTKDIWSRLLFPRCPWAARSPQAQSDQLCIPFTPAAPLTSLPAPLGPGEGQPNEPSPGSASPPSIVPTGRAGAGAAVGCGPWGLSRDRDPRPSSTLFGRLCLLPAPDLCTWCQSLWKTWPTLLSKEGHPAGCASHHRGRRAQPPAPGPDEPGCGPSEARVRLEPRRPGMASTNPARLPVSRNCKSPLHSALAEHMLCVNVFRVSVLGQVPLPCLDRGPRPSACPPLIAAQWLTTLSPA